MCKKILILRREDVPEIYLEKFNNLQKKISYLQHRCKHGKKEKIFGRLIKDDSSKGHYQEFLGEKCIECKKFIPRRKGMP